MILHTHIMVRKCVENFLEAFEFQKYPKNRESPPYFQLQFSTSESVNPKKSQFAYVLAVTTCSTKDKDPKLFSVDRYGSKKTPKHNYWMMKAHKNVFQHSQSH